jgi:hypothetical protein
MESLVSLLGALLSIFSFGSSGVSQYQALKQQQHPQSQVQMYQQCQSGQGEVRYDANGQPYIQCLEVRQ